VVRNKEAKDWVRVRIITQFSLQSGHKPYIRTRRSLLVKEEGEKNAVDCFIRKTDT
jgi:hypothetical protein